MPTAYYDGNGKPVSFGRKIGSGGEGTVFEVLEAKADFVAKIYREALTPSKASKVIGMCQVANQRLMNIAAWPVGTLHLKPKGPIVGILMPRVKEHKEIHKLYSPAHRKQEFPGADWSFLIHTARNLACAVATIHSLGHVVGDINQGNIVVSNAALVKLIDCDSFQVKLNGNCYPCEVGVAHFTPPELQNRSFRGVIRTFNHDNFGLAVLCFHLLLMGRHPFAGRFAGTGDMPIERSIEEFRFAFSESAASKRMQPPPHSLPLSSVSAPVARLFERAFGPEASRNTDRPNGIEWSSALEDLRLGLRTCSKQSVHKFHNSLSTCPWCELERETGVFFFLISVPRQAHAQFDVEAIWKRIEAITSPGIETIPSLPVSHIVPAPLPRELQRAKWINVAKKIAAAVGAAALILSGLATNGWVVVIVIILIAILFQKFDDRGERHRRRSALTQVEQEYKQVQRRWEAETGEARFEQKRRDLDRNQRDYKRLGADYTGDRRKLDASREASQLTHFLERHFIDKAKIPGIGPGRKATLASYGIETAADITTAAVQNVSGFGEVRTKDLLAWRAKAERKFVFDSRQGVDPADIAALDQRYARKRSDFERALAAGPDELMRIRSETLSKRQALSPEILRVTQQLAQARADLTVFG